MLVARRGRKERLVRDLPKSLESNGEGRKLEECWRAGPLTGAWADGMEGPCGNFRQWLGPYRATIRCSWQTERNMDRRQRFEFGPRKLLMQTLHFADKVKTEAAFGRAQPCVLVDVFSFGIVMMELFTRIRLTGTIEHDGEHIPLQEFVEKSFQGGVNVVLSIVDDAMDIPTATQGGKVVKLLELALSCTRFNAEERPVMKEVLSTLLKFSHV
ncbi:uncharacterized protein A4U43_C07F840 [Asparagus officinalis]|uniref:Serine-threonine/tyrosine-protein kinase catalytic domain-containing protein n=1 Tax=Asparagus officinalis TaxID=4686 RepID=A0A5P1E8A4_ASPOF|nr:uncharacterized protein A4U43_C07F840 [Asparagus officinalis]